MKSKILLREVKQLPGLIGIPYCGIQHLLQFESPIYYYYNNDGWRFDIYNVDGRYICTGYMVVGVTIPHAIYSKYDDIARNLNDYGNGYAARKDARKELLFKMMQEVQNNENK